MKKFFLKLINVLFTDEYYIARTNVNSMMSMIINLYWAMFKIGTGIYTRVYALCISGVFTLGLGLCKILYFKGLKSEKSEFHYILRIGITLLISGIAYTIYMASLFFFPENPKNYGLIVSLIIAVIGFFKLFFSIRGIHKMKKRKEPLIMSIKGVNLCGALANIVLTQTCLLLLTLKDKTTEIISYYNAILGTICGLISIIVSITLFTYAKRSKNKLTCNI